MKQIGLALLFSLACTSAESPEIRRPKNVVLVVLDSVRADHVGAYSYMRPTTPRLDELCANGLVFDRAYAGSSSALQSLSTLWTGRLPSSGGSTGLREAAPHDSLVSLPRLFLRAGFRTGLAANQPGLRERAFTRGFDDVEVDSVPGRWTGDRVTEAALDILDQGREKPLFLTVVYSDASEPHLPTAEFRRRIDAPLPSRLLSLPNLRKAAEELPSDIEDSPGFGDLVARYDAEVAYVDACLGQLIDGLRERGRLYDTLVVVTSSYGVEFLEHGYVGNGWTLYEEVVRVPLVVHAPAFIESGRESKLVSLADLVPSLRRLFELEDTGAPLDGRELFAPGTDGFARCTPDGAVISELVVSELTILRAAISERWKLVEAVRWVPPEHRAVVASGYDAIATRMLDGETSRPDPFGKLVRSELFDLLIDSKESHDVASANPVVQKKLRSMLKHYAEFCNARGARRDLEVTRPAEMFVPVPPRATCLRAARV